MTHKVCPSFHMMVLDSLATGNHHVHSLSVVLDHRLYIIALEIPVQSIYGQLWQSFIVFTDNTSKDTQ